MPNPFNTMNMNPNFQLKNMYQLLMNSQNPMAMFQQMAVQNPRLRPIVEMLRNKSPQEVFNNLCQQKGVNPDEFIKNIKG